MRVVAMFRQPVRRAYDNDRRIRRHHPLGQQPAQTRESGRARKLQIEPAPSQALLVITRTALVGDDCRATA